MYPRIFQISAVAFAVMFGSCAAFAQNSSVQFEFGSNGYSIPDREQTSGEVDSGLALGIRAGLSLDSGDAIGIGYVRNFATLEFAPGDDSLAVPANCLFAFYQIRTELSATTTCGFSADLGMGYGVSKETFLPNHDRISTDYDYGFYYAGSLFVDRRFSDMASFVGSVGYSQLNLGDVGVNYTGAFFRLGIRFGG